MPGAAEIDGVGFRFDDFNHFRSLRHSGKERINVRFAKEARETQLLLRRQLLIAKKQHVVIKKCLTHLRRRKIGQLGAQINTTDFRAERAGDRFDVHVKVSVH